MRLEGCSISRTDRSIAAVSEQTVTKDIEIQEDAHADRIHRRSEADSKLINRRVAFIHRQLLPLPDDVALNPLSTRTTPLSGALVG